ncbi:electron transport complex subunit RsxG [Paramagnetospirillum kuznetsovii]|uniref:Ion-translocating oxidoreductase complex subunit G n=1 Tax=Paramagnetospirillum kuznetsovii TaxID=2053833 RepID=A0A364NWZ0_9PROT|nr:electron transport complex subunit RsxG [Paramagnetospirillum kuznetsovii]RAU21573.1 electron transport complex subunit RsxG [Paramagnetospirillum kuznetsovii]
MSTIRPTWVHATILGTFCAGFGVLLAATDIVTKEPIKDRALEDKMNSLGQVIPKSIHDNNPVADAVAIPNPHAGGHGGVSETVVYRASMGGKFTGFAYELDASGGYGGPVKLMLGIDPDGKLLGVRVISHKETPGLGDKIDAAKTDWITRFTGLSLGNPPVEKWKVKKDGGQFDQFSGATITPRAVVGGIRNGLEFFAANKARMMEKK